MPHDNILAYLPQEETEEERERRELVEMLTASQSEQQAVAAPPPQVDPGRFSAGIPGVRSARDEARRNVFREITRGSGLSEDIGTTAAMEATKGTALPIVRAPMAGAGVTEEKLDPSVAGPILDKAFAGPPKSGIEEIFPVMGPRVEDMGPAPPTEEKKSIWRDPRFIKAISEAGGRIGRSLGGLSGSGADFGEKFSAPELLQTQAAEAQSASMPENQASSVMSQQLRQLITEATGTKMDESLTFNQMSKLYPYAADRVRAQQAAMAPTGKPLATAELEKVAAGEQNIADMRELEAGLEDFKDAIGPVDARTLKIAEIFGVANPQLAAYKSKVIRVLNKYIKEMTGAQLSAAEAERLKAGLQNPADSDMVFAAKLRDVLHEMERNHERRIDAYRRGGRDVSGFSGGLGKKRFKVAGRDTPYAIPMEKVDEFLAAHPGAEEL